VSHLYWHRGEGLPKSDIFTPNEEEEKEELPQRHRSPSHIFSYLEKLIKDKRNSAENWENIALTLMLINCSILSGLIFFEVNLEWGVKTWAVFLMPATFSAGKSISFRIYEKKYAEYFFQIIKAQN
jgi:hypothetical protein